MTNIDNTQTPLLKTPLSFFRDSESIEIITKALLSQQASLKNILNHSKYTHIKTQDEQTIKQTIKKIDQILDTIETYSS